MANANGKIIAPVELSDVQTVLGSAATDLKALCAHGSINIWAKYKPVVHIDALASAGRDSDWWKAEDNSRGIKISVFENITSLWDAIIKGISSWAHVPPTGGTYSAYRLTDFGGYNHKAISPIVGFSIDKEIEGSTGGRINASIGERVYHIIPESDPGVVLNIKYEYLTCLHEYQVAFSVQSESLWYFEHELSETKIFI